MIWPLDLSAEQLKINQTLNLLFKPWLELVTRFIAQKATPLELRQNYISQQFIEKILASLFGFDSYDEKLFYELLLNVKGIGPKSAFALLNSIGAGQVKKAILDKDKKLLQSAPGIGAKAAAQIILDLGNKIADWIGADDLMISSEGHKEDLLESAPLLQEALSACKELGFKESKVKPLLNQIISSGKFSKAEDLVESVLKSI